MANCKVTKKRREYKLASFFSGIGGFELGFEQAGFETVFQCEIDDFCNHILDRHWADVLRTTDIREVTYEDIPFAHVWAAGFPCQDVSVARMGPRAGLRGKRSGLFYEFARLIEEGRPPIIVIENVSGLLSSHGGRDFGIVIRTLAQFGYSVEWRVLNSKNFGVPQSRRRVYIIGSNRDWRFAGEILFESKRSEGNHKKDRQNGAKTVSPFKESFGDPSTGPIVQGLAYCLYACSARHTGTDWSRTYVSYPEGRARRLTPRECEAIQGYPRDWTLPDTPVRDVNELDTLRYTALGNAVTVPVAKWVGARIRRALTRKRIAEALNDDLIRQRPLEVS